MFDKRLSHAEHVRHYTITPGEECGWEVRLEEDNMLRRHDSYQDWHRVERALALFQREVDELTSRGWTLAQRIEHDSVPSPDSRNR
ncbi:MAG: hypothetical protein FJW27_19170 [Acidimicrobiia bacterium]|nr:hypothetical protein [Acidimicrobiia bacterium]